MIVTDNPPAGAAALAVKVYVEVPPVELLSAAGVATTLTDGAMSSSFTVTAALAGVPTA